MTATVIDPLMGTITGNSKIMTVWMKLHIENDSMGQTHGPYEPDDAIIGDLSEFDLSLVKAAFAPAYVEAIIPTDTGADNGDVAFDYNLTAAEMFSQGNKGRTSPNFPGYWRAYLQGAYERDEPNYPPPDGPVNDNDPDGEPKLRLGDTNNFLYCFDFQETIRDYVYYTNNSPTLAPRDINYIKAQTDAHEIGHQLRICHPQTATDTLMGPAPARYPLFQPCEIRTIRTRPNPGAFSPPIPDPCNCPPP